MKNSNFYSGIFGLALLLVVLTGALFINECDRPKYDFPEPQPWTEEHVNQYCDEMFAAGLTAHEWYATFWESNRPNEIPVVFGCIYERLNE